MGKGYVDSDGHIMENVDEINKFVEDPFTNQGYISIRSLLPGLDGFHTPNGLPRKPGVFDRSVGPEKWLDFLDKTGIEFSVLYPTSGLSYGYIAFPNWALGYGRAYNNWLHERYLKKSPRFKGVALIPMLDVPNAVAELRRAVKELGMVGAMIPSNGLHRHISAKEYWPIYEEAEKLDCVMAIHGGSYSNLGFNTFTVFPATRALGMPFPLAIAMTGMMVDGVFDQFPKLRVGFLEGGTSWIPMVLDRLERELEYGGLSLKKSPAEYFSSGQVFVGCEGNEKALAYSIERVGPDPFMFASDFPHELTLDSATEEIDEILERKDIREEHKMLLLGGNAKRFYKI